MLMVNHLAGFGSSSSSGAATYFKLNASDKAANFTLAANGLDWRLADQAGTYSARADQSIPTTGKWYWENTFTKAGYLVSNGIVTSACPLTGNSIATPTYNWMGTLFGAGTPPWSSDTTWIPGGGSTWGTILAIGDTCCIALDMDNGAMWFGRIASGGTSITWFNTSGTANPATNTDPRFTGISSAITWYPAVGGYFEPVTTNCSINFGQNAWVAAAIPAGFSGLSV